MKKYFSLNFILLLFFACLINIINIDKVEAVSVMDASVSVTTNDGFYDVNTHQTIGQVFTASHNKIDEVKLFMSGNGQWINNFVIAIVHYTGRRDFVTSAQANISPNGTWVGFNFANANVIPGDQYAIILPPYNQSPLWYYKHNSAYDGGEAIVDTNYRANDDFGFIVYASEADPAPAPADNSSSNNQAVAPPANSGSDSLSQSNGEVAVKSVAALEKVDAGANINPENNNYSATTGKNNDTWLRKIYSSALFWPIVIPLFTILTVMLVWFIIIRTKNYRNLHRN